MGERKRKDRLGLRDVYYQENRRQGTLSYTGTELKPTVYCDEDVEQRKCVVYEYVTYDDPYSERNIVFHMPISLIKKRK